MSELFCTIVTQFDQHIMGVSCTVYAPTQTIGANYSENYGFFTPKCTHFRDFCLFSDKRALENKMLRPPNVAAVLVCIMYANNRLLLNTTDPCLDNNFGSKS